MGLITQIPKVDNTNKDDKKILVYNETRDLLEYKDILEVVPGVTVFNQLTEPTDKRIKDIWIKT